MCHECSRFLSQTKTPELHVRQTRQQLQQQTYHNFSGRHFSNILIIKLVPLLIINTLAKCSVMSAMHGPIVIGNSMQVVTCCRLWTHYKVRHVQLCHLKGDACLKFLTPHPFILKSTKTMYKITNDYSDQNQMSQLLLIARLTYNYVGLLQANLYLILCLIKTLLLC